MDYKYIFARASFKDNLTIYLAVIITMALYLVLLTWSLVMDMKDKVILSISCNTMLPKKYYKYAKLYVAYFHAKIVTIFSEKVGYPSYARQQQ